MALHCGCDELHISTHVLTCTHAWQPTPGDDPNYWMALTHGADAKSISKKVKRMLADLDLASEARGPPVRAPLTLP